MRTYLILKTIILMFIGFLLGQNSYANELRHAADIIQITNPYVRATPSGKHITAAFMDLHNISDCEHALIAASTPIAKVTELHRTILANHVARMEPVERITIPGQEVRKLQPGGYHLMLLEITQPLQVGDRIELTLQFEDGSQITLKDVPVKKAGKEEEHHH